MKTTPPRTPIHRRRLLGLLAAPLALCLPKVANAAPEPINVQYGQTVGTFAPFPPGRGFVVIWPTTSTDFPDPRGLMSADRTTVTLADPGTYLVTWNLTIEPGPGLDRKTALDVWDDPDQAWHAGGDGNELPPTKGKGTETTLVGIAWVKSDGKTKIRVLSTHDADRVLKISDRSYESHLQIAKWPT